MAQSRPSNAPPRPEVELRRIAATLDMDTEGESLNRLGNLGSPDGTAHPAVWQTHIRLYLRGRSMPWGLHSHNGAPVAERLIRSMLRTRSMLTPRTVPSAPDLLGMAARSIAYGIMAIPGRYARLVEQFNIEINPTPRYNSQIWTITPSERAVARFLALQGFTIAEANDSYEFAVRWLRASFSTTPVDQALLTHLQRIVLAAESGPQVIPGRLPDSVPFRWDPTNRRWIVDPTVLAAANASLPAASAYASGPTSTHASAGDTSHQNPIPTPSPVDASASTTSSTQPPALTPPSSSVMTSIGDSRPMSPHSEDLENIYG